MCIPSEWIAVSKLTRLCSIHKRTFPFDDKCPNSDTHPLIAHGKVESKKDTSISEQGVEQGVTLTNKANPDKLYNAELSKDVLTASKVSHAFRFVVSIPFCDRWNDRRNICESKGLNVQLKRGIGRVYMCQFQGFKIWLGDTSITIYFPNWKKYFVEQARFGFNYALEDLKVFLNSLGEFLGCDLSWDGIYRFKTSGQHHALIHNALAKMYNRNKEKLNVYDKNGELWLVIDNSRRESIRMDDIETIGKTSDRNMDDVVDPFFNDLKDNPCDLPSVQSKKINYIVDVLNKYAVQMDKHLEVEQSTLDAQKLNNVVQSETLSTLKAIQDSIRPHDFKDLSSKNVENPQESNLNVENPSFYLRTISKYDSDDEVKLKKDLNKKDRIKRIKEDWW